MNLGCEAGLGLEADELHFGAVMVLDFTTFDLELETKVKLEMGLPPKSDLENPNPFGDLHRTNVSAPRSIEQAMD
jgi:hypothetical protein